MQNRQFILKSRPEYLAGPENFDLKISPVLSLKQGEARVAVEMVALSAWQGMRTKDFKNFKGFEKILKYSKGFYRISKDVHLNPLRSPKNP